MTSPHPIITAISERLEMFARSRAAEVDADAVFGTSTNDAVAALLLQHAADSFSGGKRLRARFAYWGWRAHTRDAGAVPDHVLALGAALEVFQAAALVHDDILDNSDTRRGRPSAWRALEAEHRARTWSGSSEEFGRSGAILLGDLLLGWSDDLLEEALAQVDAATAARTRSEYARMRRDVILGQFLDIAEEAAWPVTPDAEHADRAMRIAVLKSARYSVQQPLLMGAAIGGAGADARTSLAAIGEPLGLAFQLRDDVLGVFGDPEITGKPAGDDLREGKRTLLVAYARERMSPAERTGFDERLGADDLLADEIASLQQTVRTGGALDRVESAIAAYAVAANDAITSAGFDESTTAELRDLVTATTIRSF
ncbi:MAG: polyprenyl synthetase family protein [Microbacterium gubbeenense]|uniref:polyprenyl synthetase family protein n=1 Tax=Microbacterium gubbeenense TaxID=159896 RepID=UPI003F9DC14D